MQRILVLFTVFATVLLGQNPGTGRRIWQTGANVNMAVPNMGQGAFAGGAVRGISPNGRLINNGFGGVYGAFGLPTSPTAICPLGYPAGTGAVNIKFDLDKLSGDLKKMAQNAIVEVDGFEQAPVDRYDAWFNGSGIQVGGCMEHEVLITLEDGRFFKTKINANFRGTHVLYPRFKQPETKPVITPPVLTERPRDANGEPIPVPEVEKQ